PSGQVGGVETSPVQTEKSPKDFFLLDRRYPAALRRGSSFHIRILIFCNNPILLNQPVIFSTNSLNVNTVISIQPYLAGELFFSGGMLLPFLYP
ncbi:MAG: hypothetical protein LBQ46_09210, partial [Treponema sp.]|nr:hypothetical protein [Treponema sp.]